MDFFSLFQIGFDILLLSGLGILFVRFSRPREDDPRLSRGLQILQSKIAVIEDLSDRTDQQFRQMTQLLEQKQIDLQNKMNLADAKLSAIDISMEKSLQVAKIFEDRIPHQEIIERQNTVQYVKAARLSHQGLSFEDISKQVSIPRGELELLVKFNREHLTFSEDHLPEWIKGQASSSENSEQLNNFMGTDTSAQLSRPFVQRPVIIHSDDESEWEVTGPDFSIKRQDALPSSPLSPEESLKRLGDQFRQAAEHFHSNQNLAHDSSVPLSAPSSTSSSTQAIVDGSLGLSAEVPNHLSINFSDASSTKNESFAVSKVPLTIVRSEKYALIDDIPEVKENNDEAFQRQTNAIMVLTLETQNLQKSLSQALEQNKILTQTHVQDSQVQAQLQAQLQVKLQAEVSHQPNSQPINQPAVHQPSRLWAHLQEHNKSNLAMPPVNESLQPRIFHKVSKTSQPNEPIKVQKIQFPRVENY